jgi:uncharacterized RDD family membrane protein YckC
MGLPNPREYIRKKKGQIMVALAVAAVVFVFYTIISLIVWNEFSLSYAIAYMIVLTLAYFVFHRLLRYIIKKKGNLEL